MSILYLPALARGDEFIASYCKHYLINPLVGCPNMVNYNPDSQTVIIGDSGGYQIYKAKKKDKLFLVLPGHGISNQYSDRIVIDPEHLCKSYRIHNANYGMTLDFPCLSKSSYEFMISLKNSVQYSELMFDLKDIYCPDTQFIIPLQFSSSNQFILTFKEHSRFKPSGYAFPVRHLYWTQVAYVLSFLHSEGVNRIHFLGSSTPGLILLAAASHGLSMFDYITFDSTNWAPSRYDKEPQYLSRNTLRRKPYDPSKTKLLSPYSSSNANENSYYSTNLDTKLKLHNITAIAMYTRSAELLGSDLRQLKRFIRRKKHLKEDRPDLLTSLVILKRSIKYGHSFIDKHFKWVWYY